MLIIVYKIMSILFRPFVYLYLSKRIKNNKEDIKRIKERYGYAGVARKSGKIVWIHGASVGESLSALSIIHALEKDASISQILLTTGTVSSAKILDNKLTGKTIHQFLPLDIPSFNKRFLKYWKPNAAIFIESEIWPNLITQIKKLDINLAIINGRMTLSSYKKWLKFKQTSRKLFNNFDLCLTQNKESLFFFDQLGIKDTRYIGNLKFCTEKFTIDLNLFKQLEEDFKGRKILVAASTHPGEEKIISEITKNIRITHPEFISIIVPRHPNRKHLPSEINSSTLAVRSQKDLIDQNTDVYLADTFGELGLFYKLADFVFMGGSLVPHGGQNPIEAAYFCKNIFHGKHIENFLEVYETLNHFSITDIVENQRQLEIKLLNCYSDTKINDEASLELKIKSEGLDIIKGTIEQLNNKILNK